MTKKFLLALTVFALCVAPLVVRADWPTDDQITKWVQLPDPYGWDVKVTDPKVLADDWECWDGLPITDVHFWGSWRHDDIGQITNIHLSIHDDLTGAYPSQPADPPIWETDLGPTEFRIKWWGDGYQGWYDPNTGEYIEYDHYGIYQVNIDLTKDQWFWQQGSATDSKIYWLDIQVTVADPLSTDFGWKTSIDHWRDDAVWRDQGTAWQKLVDPLTGETLDMAFVLTTIVPEPGVFAIAGMGLLALLRYRRR